MATRLNIMAARLARQMVQYAAGDRSSSSNAERHERLAAGERWAGVLAAILDVGSRFDAAHWAAAASTASIADSGILTAAGA
ncbi:MAG: hypothetical protein ACR2IK_01400 [Chloroflexota bacterium]